MVDTQKFDDIYKQLLTDIKSIFPFTNSVIEEYEDPNYLLMFINNSILRLENISLGKSVELINSNYYLTDGIKFKEIWDDTNCTKDTKDKIWEYFHSLLYLVCNDKLESFIEENFKDHKKYEDMVVNSKKYEDYLENIKNFKSTESDTMNLEDSAIGNLAKEIMDEMGLDQNSNKEPSIADLGKMMSTTFNTINSKMQNGEFDQNKMMEEAQSMMGGMNLFGNMPNQGAPRGAQGMPRNMNVNRRKVIRKKNNANKKDASKKDINKSCVSDESKD
tara:strand:- start:64 stop:888 length:825 start_codon:yes stop_codon:yes gene_type:complete